MGGTGLYVGWDGRWVKIGIAAGKGGVRERRHLYVTHNPHFRVVAIVPCEPSRVRDMEFRLLQRLGPHAAHKRFDRGPGHVEWFLPTAEVVAEVSSLLAASAAATARAMNAASSFLARPRGVS